jgi:hypothetical protein
MRSGRSVSPLRGDPAGWALTVAALQDDIASLPVEQWTDDLTFDLADVRWIDIAALVYLTALLIQRGDDGLTTQIVLPRSQRVRDFLRAWKFQECLRRVAGIRLGQLVDRESRGYFGERQRFYTGAQPTGNPSTDLYRDLLSDRFFGLVTHGGSGADLHPQVVEEQWSKWRIPQILTVLDTNLGGHAEDISRVLVYELLANAIQHPDASRLILTAKGDGFDPEERRKAQHFTLLVWDDGIGIVETLRRCLDAGTSIRVAGPDTDHSFAIKAVDWTPSREVYRTDFTPQPDDIDEELLLASIFSGISQKGATQTATIPSPGSSPSTEIGRGLSALYSCAVDSFNGSLAVRTGSYFMNVKANPLRRRKGAPQYRAKVVRVPGVPFPGNMLSVRLPCPSRSAN